MVSLVGKAPTPSVLYLNRSHGEEIDVEVLPVDLRKAWARGRGGAYGLMEEVLERFGARYETDPRVLAVGPAAEATDFGAIGSAPVVKGRLTHADTWAGRGGMGSKMLQDHGIAAVIYGGTFVDEDFRDRKVADSWFQARYEKRLATKDFEATTKYRFDPKFETGGTFGVNFATLKGRLMAFNYRSLHFAEAERLELWERLIVPHYLAQFNEETIAKRQQSTCGEPCAAVCKKLRDEYKKDFEPYQTLGPLCGIFDQRAAELLNGKADAAGFDAISLGGVLAWLMECLLEGDLAAGRPRRLPSPPLGRRRFRRRRRLDAQRRARRRARRFDPPPPRPPRPLGGPAEMGAAGPPGEGEADPRPARLPSPRAAAAGWCRTSTGPRAPSRRCR